MKRNPKRFFQKGKRDANEKQITEVLDAARLKYKLLPPGFGADILVYNWMEFIEVKNPNVPKSDRKLTQDEIELREHCAEFGIGFHVVLHPEEMVEIVNSHVK